MATIKVGKPSGLYAALAFGVASILLCLLISPAGCRQPKNPVADYFDNAELQYETEVQKENVITALNDILDLPEQKLKTRRYKDYAGNENRWDLPTLIQRHFVPDKQNKILGTNFFHDVKSKQVQNQVRQILSRLRKTEGD